jgi:putative transposase
MAKLFHYFEENSCYFLTSTTHERKQVFNNREYAKILCNIIYNLRNREKMLLLGFVIMPEHFHLLIIPASGIKVSWIMQEIKKGSARLINKDRFSRAQGVARLPDENAFLGKRGTQGRPRPRVNLACRYSGSSLMPNKVWMNEYYDYVIRNEADLLKHINYINHNPLKRRLVETPEKYPWSSANPVFRNDLEKVMSGSGTSPTT